MFSGNSTSISSSRTDEEIEGLRTRLTNLSIYIGLLAGFPIIIAKVYQTITTGYDLSSWPTMVVYSIIAIFSFLKNSIDYRVRAGISISLLFLATFFGLSDYGYLLAAFVASLASSILSIVILGKSSGMLFALFTCGIGISTAFIMGNGSINPNMNSMDAVELIYRWWPQLIAILAFYFSIALSISLFETSLKKTVRQLEFQKRELLVLNNELTQSKDLAEKANQAKSQFISMMSHELKTPLNPILGLLNLLKDEPLNEESKEYVDLMEGSSRHLLALIEDILDYVEMDKEKLAAEIHPIPVREFCSSIVRTFEIETNQKGIKLLQHYDFGDQNADEVEVLSDPKRLRQVLSNLLSNAVKYTDEGEIKMSVRRKRDAESRCFLEFSIADTGLGIPEEMQNRISEPFKQAASVNTRKHGGIGLGLSIAYKIAHILNGRIEFTSKEGVGTTFVFSLPCIFSVKSRLNQTPPH